MNIAEDEVEPRLDPVTPAPGGARPETDDDIVAEDIADDEDDDDFDDEDDDEDDDDSDAG